MDWRRQSEVALVLLAAGASQRMGSPKQLLDVEGESMLRRAAKKALASLASRVVVVCATDDRAVWSSLAGLPVEICLNENHRRGIGTSIVAGIDALGSTSIGAAIVALADQPLVDAGTYDTLAGHWRSRDVDIVASRYGGTLGAPALFDRALFGTLRGLPDDQGCKGILLAHTASRIAAVDCPEAALDVDTPEDYARLSARG